MISGLIISLFSLLMLIPALVDYIIDGRSYPVFVESSFICLYLGLSMFFAFKTTIESFSIKQALLFTVFIWALVVLTCSLPFYIYVFPGSLADAFFESMSGLTTTGSTVVVGLDNMPKGILLWRSIINGVGGFGIIVLAITIFPFMKIGGMQIFQMESSDNFGKITPQISRMAKLIILTFFILVVLCTLSLYIAGMDWFDSISHALSTIATGGFSTKDSSIGYYNNVYFEIIISFFMILGAIPFTYFVRIWQKNREVRTSQNYQIIYFLKIVLFFVLAVTICLFVTKQFGFFTSLRHASFNVISILSTTGFASQDYNNWGAFPISIFFILPLIGGCSGSTSGSIKTFRWQIVLKYFKQSLIKVFIPHKVLQIKYGNIDYSLDLVVSVIMFIVIYMLLLFLFTLILSITGLDFISSFSAVLACLGNTGPGLGKIVGPAGNFAPLTDTAKWVLSFAMLLGRLEIFTVLILFMPEYWKD